MTTITKERLQWLANISGRDDIDDIDGGEIRELPVHRRVTHRHRLPGTAGECRWILTTTFPSVDQDMALNGGLSMPCNVNPGGITAPIFTKEVS
ncbi:hypothetical protein K3E14_000707 [Escherichia coli]|nr:hypothetical protein [Escherichia coli]